MKRFVLGACVAAGTAALASAFPYEAEMTVRHQADSASVASYATAASIPQVSAMPNTDSVATLAVATMDFEVASDEYWTTGTAALGSSQAALAIRQTAGGNRWMGYAGGQWVELTGLDATAGEHDVKIDIDYSFGSGNRKIRYTVDGTVLTAGGNAWLAIGSDADKITQVGLLGYSTAEDVVAKSGERSLEGAVAKVENISMDYSKLLVDVAVTESWGVTGAKVILHDGDTTYERAGTLADGKVTADFSDVAQAGKSYTYDIVLTGGYNGSTLVKTAQTAQAVNLYQDIDWFGFSEGAFVKATKSDNITVADNAFGTTGEKGTVTPAVGSSEGAYVVMTATLNVAGAYQWGELPETSSQFALALARDNGGNRTWAVKTGSGAWAAASADGIGTTNGTYSVLVTADYGTSPKTLTYYVNDIQLATGTLAAEKLNGVAVMGGTVSALNASYRATAAVPTAVDESKNTIELAGNQVLDLKTATQEKSYTVSCPDGKAYHLAWKDSDGKYAVMNGNTLQVKSGTPANNATSFESYVLGLDAEDATSVPFMAPVQTEDPNRLTLTIPNVKPLPATDTGVSVSYVLTTSSAQGGAETETVVDGPTFVTDLPASGVRYYKVSIQLAE